MSSPNAPTVELLHAAQRGELQKVTKWLRKGGDIDAQCQCTDGRRQSLLHAAAINPVSPDNCLRKFATTAPLLLSA